MFYTLIGLLSKEFKCSLPSMDVVFQVFMGLVEGVQISYVVVVIDVPNGVVLLVLPEIPFEG